MRFGFSRLRPNSLMLLFGVLLALTAFGGVMLYQWISRASEADRFERQQLLDSALRNLRNEFAGTMQEIPVAFRPVARLRNEAAAEGYVLELLRQWRGIAARPELVKSVSLGTRTAGGKLSFRRYQDAAAPSSEKAAVTMQEPSAGKSTNPSAGKASSKSSGGKSSGASGGSFAPQPWEPAFAWFRAVLEQSTERPRASMPPTGFAFALLDGQPVVAFPLLAVTPLPPAPTPQGLSLAQARRRAAGAPDGRAGMRGGALPPGQGFGGALRRGEGGRPPRRSIDADPPPPRRAREPESQAGDGQPPRPRQTQRQADQQGERQADQPAQRQPERERNPNAQGFPRPPFGRRPLWMGVPRGGGWQPPPEAMRRRRPPQPHPDALAPRLIGWCFLELNDEYLQQQLLPELVGKHFASSAALAHYRVGVVTNDLQQLLYASDAALTAAIARANDGAVLLFGARQNFNADFGSAVAGATDFATRRAENPQTAQPLSGKASAQNAKDAKDRVAEAVAVVTAAPTAADALPVTTEKLIAVDESLNGASPAANAWVLLAQHQDGSIAALVKRSRRQDLLVGFGVLSLLVFSVSLIIISTYRMRRLAARQMEFVAGVSHELRTPLAVIQSAGFNLGSGRVKNAERVRQYGEVIENEGRRLAGMIEQMLSYAGIQSGRKQYQFAATSVADLVNEALAEFALAFEEQGWQVEKQLDDNLPPVLADAETLRSAIGNLLHNALKYAAAGKWVSIRACLAGLEKSAGREVQITVEDRGDGIAAEDLPHLFDPFYRGKQVLASSTPGAGLGLSLLQRHIKAHGGRVSVKNMPDGGAAFTLHLPVEGVGSGE